MSRAKCLLEKGRTENSGGSRNSRFPEALPCPAAIPAKARQSPHCRLSQG
ncbi:MAG: hypothetical protein IKL01_06660 [Mailhella sp.]|nr:hypothetical protein [Mailhella sp.]